MNPIISIILVNYNSTHHTINCVSSIMQQTSKNTFFEVIIVDNNSRQEEKNKLTDWLDSQKFNNVFLVKSEKNIGFTGGNMLGIKIAKGQYIYLLNNDCILQNDTLTILQEFMDSNHNAAACVPQILNNQKQFTPSFCYMPSIATKWLGNTTMSLLFPQKYPDRKKQHAQPIKVPVICGASMFLRKSAFEKVGYMDPAYFLYLEEEDLCMKLTRAGYDIYHVPTAIIQHLGGESTKRDIKIDMEYYISLLYFLRKYYSPSQKAIIKLRYVIRELLGSIISPKRFKLFLFLLKDAPSKYSLRFKQ